MLGCSFVYFHFLLAILCPQAVDIEWVDVLLMLCSSNMSLVQDVGATR